MFAFRMLVDIALKALSPAINDPMVLKPKIEAPTATGLEMLEIAVRNPELSGKRVGDVMAALPAGVQIVALRRESHNEPASANSVLAKNDVLLATAPTKAAIAEASKFLGETARAACSKTARTWITCVCLPRARPWSAARWATSRFPERRRPSSSRFAAATPTSCRARIWCSSSATASACSRIVPTSQRCANTSATRSRVPPSYISIGIGMALGFLIGAIQVPLPAIGKISVGRSGVLIIALILGNLRRTGGMNWTNPPSANLVIRNLGLTLFLAQVGMSSGPKFAATVTDTGFMMLGLGAIVLVAHVVPILILGLLVFRMPYDEVAGIVAGACGNPAILAYANKLAPTDWPDLGYAMIFPGMTIVKILFVDIVPAFFGK
jgi:putative transport protein